MGKILAILNQKGGVGKTTTTINTGAGLKILGKKVLVIDNDPQGNLTSSLGFKNKFENTIFDVMKSIAKIGEKITMDNAIVHVDEGLDLIASDSTMYGAELVLGGVTSREKLLKKALDQVKDNYDYILIDCSPNLGFLSLNALVASDGVLVPIVSEYLPLEGLASLETTIEEIKEELNPNLEILGVLITNYDQRQSLSKEIIEAIRNHFGEKTFKTIIRTNVSLAEAPSFGQDIYKYNPKSNGAEDYMNLCKEIIERKAV